MKKNLTLFVLLFASVAVMADVDWRLEPLRVTAREDNVTMFLLCHVDLDKPISVAYDIYSSDDSLKCRYVLNTPDNARYEGDNHENTGYIIGWDTTLVDSIGTIGDWLTLEYGEHQKQINQGDYILIYGDNPDGLGSGTVSKERHLTMNIRSGTVNISGNIMSLLVGDDADRLDTAVYIPREVCFARLFNQHPHATDAILDTITTGPVDVSNMVLPATHLTACCYDRLFNSCNLLENFPDLPATELVDYCYLQMFGGCMAAVNPPHIAAETMAGTCCKHMFQNCVSLTSAPTIRVQQLVSGCYGGMYDGCTALKEVHAWFEDWGKGPCTLDWLKDVAQEGTFYCTAQLAQEIGPSYIPQGWTVVIEEMPTGLEYVKDMPAAGYRKVMINGRVYIVRDGKTFDLRGSQWK